MQYRLPSFVASFAATIFFVAITIGLLITGDHDPLFWKSFQAAALCAVGTIILGVLAEEEIDEAME